MGDASTGEDVEASRLRARQWLADTMPHLPEGVDNRQLVEKDEMGEEARRLQRLLFEGRLAGICFPREYAGLGLTLPQQRPFTQESLPYRMPPLFNFPTLSILAPPLL